MQGLHKAHVAHLCSLHACLCTALQSGATESHTLAPGHPPPCVTGPRHLGTLCSTGSTGRHSTAQHADKSSQLRAVRAVILSQAEQHEDTPRQAFTGSGCTCNMVQQHCPARCSRISRAAQGAHTAKATFRQGRVYLLLFPSQMWMPLSCSSFALVLPRMNHSSSSSTPEVRKTSRKTTTPAHQQPPHWQAARSETGNASFQEHPTLQ
jgi:hypothetical protein